MNLLMLTKFYPFGTGEAFIENEIKVMAEYYDQIVIIACEVPSDCATDREIPSNAKAYRIPASNKWKNTVVGCLKSSCRDSDYKMDQRECNTIVKRGFLAYFEEKSQDIYAQIIESGALDLVDEKKYVLYSYWFFTTARVGMLISSAIKPMRMITRAHRYDLYEEKNKANYLPYRRAFLDSYDDIFPCSDNGTLHLKEKYPEYSNKIKTSFLGTLDHGLGHGSDDGVFRVVSCSRVEPVKRVDRIIDALALIEKKNIKIEWTHIGNGSGYKKLTEKAERSLSTISYKFCGNMKNEDVMRLYSNMPFDLLVNVSSSEGLPVSIMEAISFGIPCVGTDVGGTSEIVIDGITGKLIPDMFSDWELAEVIENFAQKGNMSVSRKMCRKYWEEHFQAIPNYRKMYEYLKECMIDMEEE